jgi:hypothetical protein
MFGKPFINCHSDSDELQNPRSRTEVSLRPNHSAQANRLLSVPMKSRETVDQTKLIFSRKT